MSKGWYPIIDYDKCVGCIACNDMCKHGVYKPDTKTGMPKVVYGLGCVHGCHGCERNCPMEAIHYFGDDGKLDIDYDYETYKPELNCEGKPKVAFVCVHNSCRSQIAEALGKKLASDVFDSYSAGTALKDHINPDAVRLMKQVHGIDMELTQHNKLLSDILGFFYALPVALGNPLPSFYPLDLLVGIACGAGLRLAVYLKSKNAKKYRHNVEYGSARWGTAKDIEPFTAPKFEDNIILTKTERLMMSNRPKNPANARNKNVLIIGGSGSGKTRFWLKPNLLQMHSSYVITDPKGSIVIECGKQHRMQRML